MFPLGGLAGLPFTGKTGWGAFSAHVPADGNIIVLFAPHVGIDVKGTVGKVLREGQTSSSSACGAAIGALAALKADPSVAKASGDHLDYQMDTIKMLLAPCVETISKAENEQMQLAYEMYKIIETFLESILSTGWMGEKSQLALIGGIMINCDNDAADMFLPLKFEIRKKDGTSTDLLNEVFPDSKMTKKFTMQN